MFNKLRNNQSDNIPQEAYVRVSRSFDTLANQAYLDFIQENPSKDVDLYTLDEFLENEYKFKKVISQSQELNISESELKDICKGFEKSDAPSVTMKDFRDYLSLKAGSLSVPTEAVVTESKNRTNQSMVTTKSMLVSGTAALGLAACANVMFSTPDNSVNLDSDNKYEQVESAEQYAERVKGFIDLSAHLSDADAIMVLHADGSMNIKQVRALQDSMMDCNNALDYTDMSQDIPASCNAAYDTLLSVVNPGEIDATLDDLRNAEPTPNNILRIKMLEELSGVHQTYQTNLDNIPEGNKAAKLTAMLLLLSIMIALVYWKAQSKRSLRKDLSPSENIDKARDIDEKWNPIKKAINNMIAFSTKNSGDDTTEYTEPRVQSHIDTLPEVKEEVSRRYVGEGVDLSPEAKLAAAQKALKNPTTVEGGTLKDSDWDGFSFHPKKK